MHDNSSEELRTSGVDSLTKFSKESMLASKVTCYEALDDVHTQRTVFSPPPEEETFNT